MGRLWVAELRVSSAVAEKISAKHDVTESEVRDQLVNVTGLQYVERTDSGYEVQVWIRGREHLAVVFPKWGMDPDDVYYLATVYRRRAS